MPTITLHRDHSLGLAKARQVAFKWAEKAEDQFDMACTYEEGKTEDLVTFKRSGVDGTLRVTKDSFDLDAKLGFLLGAFKDKITTEIERNLDALLGAAKPAKPAAKTKPK